MLKQSYENVCPVTLGLNSVFFSSVKNHMLQAGGLVP
jgi:hypothetical protein